VDLVDDGGVVNGGVTVLFKGEEDMRNSASSESRRW